jgi:heme/copper-type cytochrome/quinol oxidase subunit 4
MMVALIIAGSLFIMTNLNQNMAPMNVMMNMRH